MENIIADIGALGLRYEKLSYTSDYFPQMLDLAERLIKAGHLYADDTPVEQMREVGFDPDPLPLLVSNCFFFLFFFLILDSLSGHSFLEPRLLLYYESGGGKRCVVTRGFARFLKKSGFQAGHPFVMGVSRGFGGLQGTSTPSSCC